MEHWYCPHDQLPQEQEPLFSVVNKALVKSAITIAVGRPSYNTGQPILWAQSRARSSPGSPKRTYYRELPNTVLLLRWHCAKNITNSTVTFMRGLGRQLVEHRRHQDGQIAGRKPSRGDRRKGQAMIEFGLCFLLFMAVTFGFCQIAMTIWMKSTLHFAVREGVRFAMTGRVIPGTSGHDASIKQVIRRRTAGLLTQAQADQLVSIQYYTPSGVNAGSGTGSNAGGNTVVLTVNDFPVPTLASSALTWVGGPISVSARAVGRQEPYPNPPAR